MQLENRPEGRFLFLDTLIFRDDRRRTTQVELVAEADLNLILVDRPVRVEDAFVRPGTVANPTAAIPGAEIEPKLV